MNLKRIQLVLNKADLVLEQGTSIRVKDISKNLTGLKKDKQER